MTELKLNNNFAGELELVELPRQGNLTDWVTETLYQTIETGNLAAGTKLPTEMALCDAMSVSRTVVREAIARLKAAGRVTSRRGSGIFVSAEPPRSQEIFSRPKNYIETLDALEFRTAVEVEAARLAARRLTSSSLVSINKAHADFRQLVENRDLSGDADLRFHIAIARASKNPLIVQFMEDMQEITIPHFSDNLESKDVSLQQTYLENTVIEHSRIYDAIEASDPVAAADAMRTHLDRARRLFRRLLATE